jgi:hypothetical protein
MFPQADYHVGTGKTHRRPRWFDTTLDAWIAAQGNAK